MNSRLAAFLLFSAATLSAQSLKLYEAVEPHMGTLFQIKLYASDELSAQRAFHAAFSRITELDKKLSDYKPDSELNLSTQSASSHQVAISEDLETVLSAAQTMSAQTGGALDVTVGPLTRLWRQARKEGHPPSADLIQIAQKKCGYQKLHIDPVLHTMEVDSPDIQLDLGAIAKGYAADEALKIISALGIRSALVAASGDLAFSDAPPGQVGWRIGVDGLQHPLLLSNAAVSTSGASEQHLVVGGKRYSHIIDPKTGLGLQTDITVTAISRHGLRADPAATAVSVLGCEKGLSFIENNPDLAAFVVEKNGIQLHSLESTRFKKLYGH